MQDLYKRFKALTKCSYRVLGDILACSRENISKIILGESKSKVGKAGVAYAMIHCIDKEVVALRTKIEALIQVKEDIQKEIEVR